MQSETPNQTPQIVIDGGSADVMRQFQQLMSQFLQTQALVMTAYLQGAPAQGAVQAAFAPVARPTPQRPVSPSYEPAYAAAPVPAMAPTVPVPAAVAVAAPPVAVAPQPVPVAPIAAAPAPAPAAKAMNGVHNGPAPSAKAAQEARPAVSVLAQLLEIVSDRTGYPPDMLSVDAHMEADLGIDSIKRMEILTVFQQMHAGEQRGAFQGAMERLTAIKTLRETAAVLEELVAAQGGAAVAEVHAT